VRIPATSPVVVGVTGTPAGLAAVRLGAREAVTRGRQLRVVHAVTPPSPSASQVVEEAVATAQRSTPGVRVTGQLVDGPADRVLLRLSRIACLLVLGDDDLAASPRLAPTSVLVQTVARSWCPVLLGRGPRPPSGRLLVAVDGSRAAALALRHAAAESRRRRCPVDVVHVVPELGGRLEEDGRRLLDAAVAAVPELTAYRVRLLSGATGPALVRASGRARLLILGPRGTREAGLLGSVAREVLHRAACPTMFVHGRGIPAQRAAGRTVDRVAALNDAP
jgi:nucleotide-binding universal stress UspA family protein